MDYLMLLGADPAPTKERLIELLKRTEAEIEGEEESCRHPGARRKEEEHRETVASATQGAIFERDGHRCRACG
jgi:hypothetical protein